MGNLYIALLAIFLVGIFTTSKVSAAKGNTPNGKPFIELNGQIIEVEGEISSLQDQMESLIGRVESIEDGLTAYSNAITELQNQNTVLSEQILLNGGEINALQETVATIENELLLLKQELENLNDTDETLLNLINEKESMITALNQSISNLSTSLQSQIDNNLNLIEMMQLQIEELETQISLKQNIITGSCAEGESLLSIEEDGSVVCDSGDYPITSVADYLEIKKITQSSPFMRGKSRLYQDIACPNGYTAFSGGVISHPPETYVASSNGPTVGTFTQPLITYWRLSIRTLNGSYWGDGSVKSYALCLGAPPIDGVVEIPSTGS